MEKKADTQTNRKIKAVVDMMFDDIPTSICESALTNTQNVCLTA